MVWVLLLVGGVSFVNILIMLDQRKELQAIVKLLTANVEHHLSIIHDLKTCLTTSLATQETLNGLCGLAQTLNTSITATTKLASDNNALLLDVYARVSDMSEKMTPLDEKTTLTKSTLVKSTKKTRK